MRPPGFWSTAPDRPGLAARLLAPLGRVYAGLTARRLRRPGYRAGCPVICVGNLNVGGTGKTPTVIALIERIAARGVAVHVVTRGHGGRLTGPVVVDPTLHTATDVGDEPLLLAAFAPTVIARDRSAGVRMAEEAGADIVILDDGFQNPTVVKDLALVVVDAAVGFGNGLCLPAGPLREPVATGLARADLILSIGDVAAQSRFAQDWGKAVHPPRMTGELRPLQTGMDWQGTRVVAFAGIGRPEKFFATLQALGAEIVGAVALDDHQPLTEPLLGRLDLQAKAARAQLVTTEKDAVRLPPEWRARVLTLPVRLHIDNWEPFDARLQALGLALPKTAP